MSNMLTKEYIQSVIERENLVVRNLQVTQGYYRISSALKKYVSSKNVNWTTFATHASKTAGQALRHELMPRLLKSSMLRLGGYDNTFMFLNEGLASADLQLSDDQNSRLGEAFRQVSLLISDGNITVFDELALPFTNFINTFKDDWTYDKVKFQAFLDENLIPGPLTEGGQEYLMEAFTAFYNARFETRAKAKAEYVLMGNLLIGLHEQTRLQPQIEQAMAVPLDLFSDTPQTSGERIETFKKQPALMRGIISKTFTQMMMLITLPSRELKLGETVIAPTGVTSFPSDLLDIENPRCHELVRMFETEHDTLSGSGAKNWASLRDRMSFVVDFFRSHQQYKRLWEPPFSEQQALVIESGHFPAGPL
jgi:hypothetical protein